MVGEANAAIEGALAAGATDILVNDSHWNMYNLLPAELDPSARVLQGEKAWSMVAGAQPAADGAPAFDVALFVGYHARAGHPTGTIAHTYTGRPVETRLDGRPTGEYGFNALVLGAWGIPVGMVAGDDALAEEVEAGCRGPSGSSSRPSTAATARSRSTRRSPAIGSGPAPSGPSGGRRPASCELLRVEPPVVIEVDYAKGVVADFAAIVPGAERVGDRGVRYSARTTRSPRSVASSPATGWPVPSA